MTADEVACAFTELYEDRPGRFEEMAAAVFSFQQSANPAYSRYCKALSSRRAGSPEPRLSAEDASFLVSRPHLPVAAFKHGPVTAFPPEEAEQVFESSGTGTGNPSRHYVKDLAVYDRSIDAHFERVFGPGPFVFATHLPHYSEKGRRSSLLYMVEHLTERYGLPGGGSFLKDAAVLERAIETSKDANVQLIVFGAAFGLLDFVESDAPPLPRGSYVIETGGMKTRRREVNRNELHDRLAGAFRLDRSRIRSEYGMCELMSQCYTRGESLFYPPPWMRFSIVEPENPFRVMPQGEAGALAIFDLANVYSVSAILTEDRAVRRSDGFEVLGRLSGAELRGCNFLLENA